MNLRRKSQKTVDGVAPPPKTKAPKRINLKHKKVCITGTIHGLTRNQAQHVLWNKHKAIYSPTITRSCDYLIVGYGVGQTKLKLAKRYGIKVIDATEIFK